MVLNLKKVVVCAACLLVTSQTMASAQRFKRGRGPSLVQQTALNREWASELLERQVLDALIAESSSLMPLGVLGSPTAGAENMAYWRGRAYWDIGLFGDAEMDFLGLQNHPSVRMGRYMRDHRQHSIVSTTEFTRLKDLLRIPQWGDRDFWVRHSDTWLHRERNADQVYANFSLVLWNDELRGALDYLKRLERLKSLLPQRSSMLPQAEPEYYDRRGSQDSALPIYFEHQYYIKFKNGYFYTYAEIEKLTRASATGSLSGSFGPEAIGMLNQGRGNLRGGLNIYHDEDAAEDEWTQGVMSTLEQAYTQAKSSLFGSDVPLVSVFIFSDRARYEAFFKEYHGEAPKAQEWITYNRGVMLLCPRDKERLHIAPDDVTSDYFRSTLTQVYAHCLLRRALGTIEVPSWLNNGLAMTLASKLVPEDEKLNDYAVKRLVAANALLDLETLSKVPASTQYMTDKDDAIKGALQQSYHMTRYLLQSSKSDDVASFFNRAVNDEKTVEQAFEETYGTSPEAFHASWLANIQKTFGGAVPQTSVAVQPLDAVSTLN